WSPFYSPRTHCFKFLNLKPPPGRGRSGSSTDPPPSAGDCHNCFFARGFGGQRSFGQSLPPFAHGFVIGLETHQTPGGLHQRRAQARITVLGHAALHSGVATAHPPRTQPRITTHWP